MLYSESMRPRLFILLCFLAGLAGAIFTIVKEHPDAISIDPQILEAITAKEIIAPPPLRGPLDQSGNALTAAGILAATNRQRARASLPPLPSNATLNLAAQNKLADMFNRQYFDHVNPDGAGPADVVDGVGYAYLRVGENLALGGFAGDADLVQAWVDSPEHKANIFSTGFTELGVAAGPGTFEGQPAWLAVQTFGLPLSACPTPNPALQTTYQQKKTQIERLGPELNNLSSGFTALLKQGQDKIAAGNRLIEQGNELAQKQKSNQEAQILWDQANQLQAAGQALVDQAVADRDAYNEKVTVINQLSEETKTLVGQINAQIKAYNDCVSSF